METITVKEITEAVSGELLAGNPDTEVYHVCIDSRQAGNGSLFVPIIGERVDAHQFIGQVFESGAAAVLTSRSEVVTEGRPHIYVADTEKALGALAVWYKSHFSIPVIGITGSVGKTSTKEMIAAALEVGFNVLKTAGNQNSNIGVPLTLFRLEKNHEIAVIEMGISDFEEMAELADFVCPDTAVVTNIGVAHLAQFKTRENIMAQKLLIAKNFSSENVLYLNGDDMLLKMAAVSTGSVRYFGTSAGEDYYADNIHIHDGRQCFTFHGGSVTEEISLLQLGLHNVYNAVVALAIAMQYGISPDAAKRGIESYAGIAMRQQVSHLKDGIKVIDDTYNASPDSIRSGIEVLLSMDNSGRKIAVLADVLELGESSQQCHYDTGRYIAGTAVDAVVTVGSEMKALVKALKDLNPSIAVHAFDNNEAAAQYVISYLKPGDALLCKGSRGMHQEEIVAAVKKAFAPNLYEE